MEREFEVISKDKVSQAVGFAFNILDGHELGVANYINAVDQWALRNFNYRFHCFTEKCVVFKRAS